MKKKSCKKKYAYGTVRQYLETPQEAMVENDIAKIKAKQEAESDPWAIGLSMLGNMAINYGTSMMGSKYGGATANVLKGGAGLASMAYGGDADGEIEAEGEEVVETADGQVSELKGPKHEQGGIDLDVPPGTTIFSDRIMVEGDSLAKRKKIRAKEIDQLEKNYMKYHADKIFKQTYGRRKEALAMEEAKDLQLQDMINFIAGSHGKAMFGLNGDPGLSDLMTMFADPNMAAGGLNPDPPEWTTDDFNYSFLQDIVNQEGLEYDFNNLDDRKAFQKDLGVTQDGIFGPKTGAALDAKYDLKPLSTIQGKGIVENPTLSTPGFNPNTAKTGADGDINFDINPGPSSRVTTDADLVDENTSPNTNTFGNAVGLIGNMISTFGPYMNTLKNRAGDTPNINAFEDYGNDALEVNEEQQAYIDEQRDLLLKKIDRGTATSKRANRNTARGVNTQRALDLASDMNANISKENAFAEFSKQMMNILGQKASLEQDQDRVVMQGEKEKDLNDRMDRDNFYTQLAQDIATMGQGVQQTGKDLNQASQQQAISKILSQLNKYGVTFDENYNLQNPEN